MNELPVENVLRTDTTAMRTFGVRADALAARLLEAAARTRQGDPGPAVTALGPVAAGFLAAVTATHAAHVRELGRLGELVAGIGTNAVASADAYDRTVADTEARLQAGTENL
ncbi:type VII secretion target [Rhodococcus sp. Z13]|uniref:Type VII secretion target n=1 Tax=Rhodococcus sacchari TaxID=2962047 RepID=A0ACD4DD60_9NOCA|nr:type VII secretion target [Rhodococcus sp. Z13]UYP17890.1 type VII secretion target [Rhodococcus sp. Z13]